MRKLIIILLCVPLIANGQKFWLTTNEFPGWYKTGITGSGDSILYAGLINGIIRSYNEGKTWETVLKSSYIFTVFSDKVGKIYVGGMGKIFTSENQGKLWDSIKFNHDFPIISFVENGDGVFAITKSFIDTVGYVGAGVYFFDKTNKIWEQRNNGLGNSLACDQIAADKNNRLYLAINNEAGLSSDNGLFISDNNGLLWKKVHLKIDGRGAIVDNISISYCTEISISPDDSIYLSLYGVAGNNGVQLNLHKSISDLDASILWKTTLVGSSSWWWSNKPLNKIYFAKNGDRYSSANGSLLTGGTYFMKANGTTWNQHTQGLGYDAYGQLSSQSFYELSNGKIFMVQYLDERIYWADTSMVTSIPVPDSRVTEFQLFPNPVSRGKPVKIISSNSLLKFTDIRIIDITGKQIQRISANGSEFEFQAPDYPAVFFVIFNYNGARYIQKLIVQ